MNRFIDSDLPTLASATISATNTRSNGYWIALALGDVNAYGDAPPLGGIIQGRAQPRMQLAGIQADERLLGRQAIAGQVADPLAPHPQQFHGPRQRRLPGPDANTMAFELGLETRGIDQPQVARGHRLAQGVQLGDARGSLVRGQAEPVADLVVAALAAAAHPIAQGGGAEPDAGRSDGGTHEHLSIDTVSMVTRAAFRDIM